MMSEIAGDAETAALVAHLGTVEDVAVWRELMNGSRYVVFLDYRGHTYCLLPLHYERVKPERYGSNADEGRPYEP